MSRPILLVLFLVSSIMAMHKSSDIAARLNNEATELYNTGQLPQLAQNLFNEDVIVVVKEVNIVAKGREQVEALIKKTAGNIVNIEVQETYRNAIGNTIVVVANLNFQKRGVLYRFALDEKIINGKFSSIILTSIY